MIESRDDKGVGSSLFLLLLLDMVEESSTETLREMTQRLESMMREGDENGTHTQRNRS